MKTIEVYMLTIGLYGILDILVQKNSSTIFHSGTSDRTYLPVIVSFIANLAAIPAEWTLMDRGNNHAMMIAGFCICLIATIIRVSAQLNLKHAFSTRVELQEDHALVKTGLYRFIRHPMYLAIIMLLAGADIMLRAEISWIFTLVSVYFIILRIRKEETFLKLRLEGYSEYVKVTRKFIPFIY